MYKNFPCFSSRLFLSLPLPPSLSLSLPLSLPLSPSLLSLSPSLFSPPSSSSLYLPLSRSLPLPLPPLSSPLLPSPLSSPLRVIYNSTFQSVSGGGRKANSLIKSPCGVPLGPAARGLRISPCYIQLCFLKENVQL